MKSIKETEKEIVNSIRHLRFKPFTSKRKKKLVLELFSSRNFNRQNTLKANFRFIKKLREKKLKELNATIVETMMILLPVYRFLLNYSRYSSRNYQYLLQTAALIFA